MDSATDVVTRLRQLDTEAVSDALDSLGLDQCLLLGVTPLWPSRRIAGRVVTVQLVAIDASTPTPTRHLGTRAVDSAGHDNVIVVDNGARDTVAGWGGLLSRAASRRGIAGVVVYGAVRDVAEAHEVDFPVYGTARVPRTARGRVIEQDAAGPLQLGVTRVDHGDYIIADTSGALIVPEEAAAEVATRAERIFSREQAMARAIDAGVAVTNVMNGDYEHMLSEV